MTRKEEILERLFILLKNARQETRAEVIINQIWQIWLDSGDASLNLMMKEGNEALTAGNYTEAIKIFTEALLYKDSYAEAWNKRATAYFLRGNYKQALEDIKETLKREPRHFGAMAGAAHIYATINDTAALLRSLESLYEINPSYPNLAQNIHNLKRKLGRS
jgi:tetratricopeptide (TPR) repeat protein